MVKIPKIKIIDRTEYIKSKCNNKSVLDLGCCDDAPESTGLPFLHNEIVKVASKVTGVDINPNAIEKLGKNIVICNVENLDKSILQGQKYDIIVASELIEHLNNPGLFLQSVKDFLKDDGLLIIATPSPFSIKQILLYFCGYETSPISHTCYFSYATLKVLLGRFGFKIIECYFFHWGKQKIHSKIINFLIEKIPFLRKFADHIIIAAIKDV